MDDVEEVTPTAPRPLRRRLLIQDWLDVTMLHWEADPDLVQRQLPAGTRPDLIDGRTYVGLIGFRMRRLGFGPGPGLPHLGDFLETNVRLYSVDDEGRRGVYFCSLDAERLLPVIGARVAMRLPYMWSSMRLDRDDDVLTYYCTRRLPRPTAQSVMRVRIGPPLPTPSALDHFVTARWGLHTRWYGRTLYLPNVHEQWPLRSAELLTLDDPPETGLLARAGFEVTGPPLSAVYAPKVSVRFGPGSVLPT